MTLYTYVANRNDLIVLMVDQVFGRTGLPPMSGDAARRGCGWSPRSSSPTAATTPGCST